MREMIRELVRISAETLPISEPIYEFGSLQVPGQEGFADIRSVFPGKKYVGADMRHGPGVDVVLDLHQIDLPSDSVGTVLILDTLEHVEFPRKAMSEVHRILKPGGVLIMSSVMNFPIHDYPFDYWRFTPEGFTSLLRQFDASVIDYAGESSFPHTIVGIGFKAPIPGESMNEIKSRVRNWRLYWSTSTGSRRRGLAELFLPPILLENMFVLNKGLGAMREGTFWRKFLRFALGKAHRLPGSGTLEAAFMATRLRAAERRCSDFRDYFRLLEGLSPSRAPLQKESEIAIFFATASKLPIDCALEIGTGNGGTFYLLCKAARPNATLVSIDLQNNWRRAVFLKSYAKLRQKLHIISGNSGDQSTLDKVMSAIGSRRLDLLFIDGDHSFTGVRKDFELYSRLVRHGGIIAMHDILPDYKTRYGIETPSYTGGVPQFWTDIKSRWKSEEFVESYDQDGYGIGMIRWEPLPPGKREPCTLEGVRDESE